MFVRALGFIMGAHSKQGELTWFYFIDNEKYHWGFLGPVGGIWRKSCFGCFSVLLLLNAF